MRIKRSTYAAAMAAVICICSWISIPMPVPFTLQTFGVSAALFLLGGRLGTVSIAIYILAGAAGLPVFAGFQGGPGHLLGPTGGYIIGFIFQGLVYWTGGRYVSGKGRYFLQLAGLVLCYLFGTIWYNIIAGGSRSLPAVLGVCVLPYVIPDMLKLWLACLVTGRIKKHIDI